MVEEFDRRRRYMVERINSIPGLSCLLPHGAFYVMLNITGALGKTYKGKEIHSSLSFCSALLEGEKVAIVPGIAIRGGRFLPALLCHQHGQHPGRPEPPGRIYGPAPVKINRPMD